ncbi:hypothetical protein Cni_G22926 [Canna indica]|uniref:DUF641 domain-containing protein n=1 Tax=Canna indica TaxID=4628 RepID=A0AAQ3QM05_9LILI|nr:hypothetical protein Cni_G22926 [Canna indica]
MEPARGAPLPVSPTFGAVARTITKILRLRHSTAGAVGCAADPTPEEFSTASKLKLSLDLGDYSGVLSDPRGYVIYKADDDKLLQQQQKDGCGAGDREAMKSLLANLFASVSAVKAAYAQLQVAHRPYDPDSIQSADGAVVAELRRLSELKQSYIKNQFNPATGSITAQIQEQRNLIKTYKITTGQLVAELELKDSEIAVLRAELFESERKSRALEAKLHPKRSLAALDALHLSGLDSTHFLTALRYAYKSIRSFVDLMVKEMESAGWDLRAAAGSIQPDVRRKKPCHWTFAFESFVCRRMFSDFHHQSFGLSAMDECSAWDRRQFFEEFTRLKSMTVNQTLRCMPSRAAQFCRGKYLALVHPKMESSLFGDLDQRAKVSSGQGFPDSEFFGVFAEMARRVWLLHCLFFSLEPGTERSIFQVRRGTRFSEVHMESVAVAEDELSVDAGAVGFTVVPGFKVDRTLIQCKVYLIS